MKKFDNDIVSIRPKRLDNLTGQEELISLLNISIKSCEIRNQSLDHILLYGPPGLGKTTLAYIVANELNVNIKTITGSNLTKVNEVINILATINKHDCLFIDEIHRIPGKVAEVLYTAMEDNYVDIILSNESNAKSVRMEIPSFTLIGATTRIGDLESPFRSRFGIIGKFDYYTINELSNIISRRALIDGYSINESEAMLIASVSRGTPRVANKIFSRIRDYSLVLNDNIINVDIIKKSLLSLGITSEGLTNEDIRYLNVLINNFAGGPVGIKSLATILTEEQNTIEDVYEPYLVRNGYIKKTLRGRVALSKAYEITQIEGLEDESK